MPDLIGPKIAYLGYCGLIDSAGVTRIAQMINSAVNSSVGGYVGDGIYLYHHLRGLPIPVVMYNTETVASIATTLFLAGEHRICSANAIFMMHPVAVGLQAQSSSAPLVAALQSALTDEGRTEAILRERTTMPDALLAARRQNDIYIPAKDALSHGLVHKISEFSLPPGNQIVQI